MRTSLLIRNRKPLMNITYINDVQLLLQGKSVSFLKKNALYCFLENLLLDRVVAASAHTVFDKMR